MATFRTDTSVINGSVQALATGVLYNVANLTPTLSIKGNIDNAGLIRRGPGYTANGEGDLSIHLAGNLVQNGPAQHGANRRSFLSMSLRPDSMQQQRRRRLALQRQCCVFG